MADFRRKIECQKCGKEISSISKTFLCKSCARIKYYKENGVSEEIRKKIKTKRKAFLQENPTKHNWYKDGKGGSNNRYIKNGYLNTGKYKHHSHQGFQKGHGILMTDEQYAIAAKKRIGQKRSQETKLKMSIKSTGRKHSDVAKKKIGKALKERWADPEYKQRQRDLHKMKVGVLSSCWGKHWTVSKKGVENLRIAAIKKWEDPEYRKKVLAVNFPNKAEKILQEILNNICQNKYEYVGNGAIRIGRKIPDFIDKENNKIIELFGERWHEKIEEPERKDYYKKHGYDTLIIWSNDLFKNRDKTKNNIIEFSNLNV